MLRLFVKAGFVAALVGGSPGIAQNIVIPDGVCLDTRGCDAPPEPAAPDQPISPPVPSAPPQLSEAQRIAPLSAAFWELLDLAEQYRLVQTDRLRPNSRARTRRELEGQVRPFYVAVHAAYVTRRSSVSDTRDYFEQLRHGNQRLRQEIAGQQTLLANATAERDKMRAYPVNGTEALRRREAAIESASRAVNNSYSRARKIQSDVATLLAALSPEKDRAAWNDFGNGPLAAHRPLPLILSGPARTPAPNVAAALPASTLQARVTRFMPSMSVPLEEQLRYARWMIEQTPKLRDEQDRLARRNIPLVREAKLLEGLKDQYVRASAVVQQEIDAIAPAYTSALAREERATLNAAIMGNNLTRAALTEYTWLYVRDQMLRPALVSVLGEAAVPGGSRIIELANQLRNEPLRFAGSMARARSTRVFLDVEQAVSEMPANFMARAREAVAAMDGPGLGNAASVRDAIFTDAGAEGAALVEKASDADDGITTHLRRFMMGNQRDQ